MSLVLRPHADEAEACWNELVIGRYFIVFYENDHVWHERIALWSMHCRRRWYVLTPDGDIYCEDLECMDPENGPVRVKGLLDKRRAPRAIGAKIYRFKEVAGEHELKGSVREAHGLAVAACKTEKEQLEDPTHMIVNGELRALKIVFPHGLGGKRLWTKGPPAVV